MPPAVAIKLNGAAIEKLQNLIAAAFNDKELEQLVRFKLNIGLYDELVAPEQALNTLVFELLMALERRGTTVYLLRAVWDARPQKADLRTAIEEVFPGVRDPLRSPEEEARAVAEGVEAIRELLKNPSVKAAISESRRPLEQLMDDIGVLATYKALHDYLQTIQLGLYPRLLDQMKGFSMDIGATQELEHHVAELREICQGARKSAETLPDTGPLRVEQLQWVEDLEKSAGDLNGAVAALDELAAQHALHGLKQILRSRPVRVDYSLRLTAEKLPLSQLGDTIRAVVAAVSAGGGAPPDLRTALQSLENLLVELGGRVVVHKHWQELDNEFWQFEEFVEKGSPQSVEQFIQLWPSAKAQVEALWRLSPEADWAKEAQSLAVQIDNVANGSDAARGSFKRFRTMLFAQFYTVDRSLKSRCDAILAIRPPLQLLLSQV